MLGKTELKILRILSEGDSVKDISEKVGISKGKVSVSLKNLEEMGFIIRERNNRKISIKMGNAEHASLFFDFLREYPTLPIEKLLTQKRIAMLSVIENEPPIVAKIVGVSSRTVYNAIKDFLKIF